MQISALLSLLHLSSPSLPIGAFAYSQGLEGAVELQWVKDEASLKAWLSPLLRSGQANLELPLLKRFYQAWQLNDLNQIDYWQQVLLANRETAELVMEEQKLGQTLHRLLASLDVELDGNTRSMSYLPLYAKACVHFNVPLKVAATGWLWSWLENQVTVACKTVPLGQTSAQKVLIEMMPVIEQAIETGLSVSDDNIGLTLPNFAMVSAWHETQYSRLFRS
ncbi:urease accessory protein UreF [Vibrio sp. Y2-5]|uniref:urease accessory protein UreF n=1 Tax=Vibrio TaxID=662 RepID=UPI00142D38B3|nr:MULTISPECIES: urease accessory UreF family protein [Vibrio]MBD0788261.1 urease accessory protein UreF [Vibrio sp. Y2-5]NIY91618.1 urease accessory protein UreF [Vibrio diazotrophicus]